MVDPAADTVALLVLPPDEETAAALGLELGGAPAVDRTIDVLESAPEIAAVVVARRRTTPGSLSAIIRRRQAHTPRLFGAAGATRVEGLALAMEVAPPSARILVHDANRPLLTAGAVSAALAAARDLPAAVAAQPVTNTYKEVAKERVRRTVPRDQLFQVHGPWIFDRPALERALEGAKRRGYADPDELVLCQKARLAVRLIEADFSSVAILGPADVEFAGLLQAQS